MLVGPGGKGADGDGGFTVGEIGFVVDVEVFGCDGEGVVDRVGAAVGANGVAAADGTMLTADDDRATFGWVFFSPVHGKRIYSGLARIGG